MKEFHLPYDPPSFEQMIVGEFLVLIIMDP